MAHDIHFLSRLERLDDRLVDLAMSLYRNVPLVKAIVEEAAPGDADRVALALADGPTPPHVLVTRDGRFVTCLARGMKHDLPVVSRVAVDRALEAHENLRRLRQVADELAEDSSYVARTMRVFEGPRLSREEITSLVGWAPVLGEELVRSYFAGVRNGDRCRRKLMTPERLKPKHDKLLPIFWENAWAAGHLLVATAEYLRGPYGETLPDDPPGYRIAATATAIAMRLEATVLRAVWAMSQLADVVFDDVEWTYLHDEEVPSGWASMLSLVAIGLRTPALRDRAASVLARPPATPPGDDGPVVQRRWLDVLENPRGALERRLEDATRRLESQGVDLSGFDDASILASMLYDQRPLLSRQEPYMRLIDGVAFVAACDTAEELYLPQTLLDRLPAQDAAASARAFIEELRAPTPDDDEPEPMRAPKVGRNEPCHCGSGVKFKRCHGR